MQLFNVGERVSLGWPIRVDMQERRVFVNLGRKREDHGVFLRLRLQEELATVLFNSCRPLRRKFLEKVELERGVVAIGQEGAILVKEPYRDRKALVRVGIAPGVGGKIWYMFGKGVLVLVEGILGADEDVQFPLYILQMDENTTFEVHRSGELEDLPVRMKFIWTGTELKRT